MAQEQRRSTLIMVEPAEHSACMEGEPALQPGVHAQQGGGETLGERESESEGEAASGGDCLREGAEGRPSRIEEALREENRVLLAELLKARCVGGFVG